MGSKDRMTNLPTIDEMQKWKKRYKLDDSGKAVIDTIDGGDYCTVHGNEAYNLCIDMNKLYEENKELKQELQEFKDYVFSDENILCYSCVNCISKGIYEVECSEKGKVEVHTSCLPHWVSELRNMVE